MLLEVAAAELWVEFRRDDDFSAQGDRYESTAEV
jgi:hypothetical protein